MKNVMAIIPACFLLRKLWLSRTGPAPKARFPGPSEGVTPVPWLRGELPRHLQRLSKGVLRVVQEDSGPVEVVSAVGGEHVVSPSSNASNGFRPSSSPVEAAPPPGGRGCSSSWAPVEGWPTAGWTSMRSSENGQSLRA
eukprot:CAMPEP_0181453444 /NCGR_PEP_ID=MMETSP1110-20121109/29728_1 /TAXON_ID=174948 /ORGANISM="Symbiodinium sp., Strain CCMP421" /LENGTH=138 /DNA_ID=CAMNT_0023577763 /DNA_START=312 /DNA_END=727 /DNA_ORIENTATION=+